MKKILQNFRTGETIILESPTPAVMPKSLLINSEMSLISAGTERMLAEFGSSSYLAKARSQPEKVKMVIEKVMSDGLMPTLEAVNAKLDQPFPMGYSNVGRVIQLGKDASGFEIGDRIVSNGNHAEQICAGQNLCAKVPSNVPSSSAVFAVVGSIALQGIRLAKPTVGEAFVVTGLGLIGLLAVQILKANGCRVLGLDFDDAKLDIARSYGVEAFNSKNSDALAGVAESFSRGAGVDGVIITASAKDDSIIRQAAQMCRKRGRIVLVGMVGLNLDRNDFYEKELSFQVSCSYGPGRYDPEYEDNGVDYPFGFVRWTEQRNFEAILDLMSAGLIDTELLTSATFRVDSAAEAYALLKRDRSALGIVLQYQEDDAESLPIERTKPLGVVMPRGLPDQRAIVGALGAGNYASRFLLPAFKQTGALFKTIVSSQGSSGSHVGKKIGFAASSTDPESVFKDNEINTVIIATQHDSHAEYVMRALDCGKNVFVEKPLALSWSELDEIESLYKKLESNGKNPVLVVGFNRRFSPFMQEARATIEQNGAPISIIHTCNAGQIPADSWVQDALKGGGRIVGEACHFVDACRFLAGARIESTVALRMSKRDNARDCKDTVSMTMAYENGSVATVHYFANGNNQFPKERIEIFQDGRTLVIDNFRRLRAFGMPNRTGYFQRQNKGQNELCQAFVDAVNGTAKVPISFDEIIEVSRATLSIRDLANESPCQHGLSMRSRRGSSSFGC